MKEHTLKNLSRLNFKYYPVAIHYGYSPDNAMFEMKKGLRRKGYGAAKVYLATYARNSESISYRYSLFHDEKQMQGYFDFFAIESIHSA